MELPIAVEIRLILVLAAVCLAPGSALLGLTGGWRHWPGLQRPIVAVGLSLAFYPVLFYGVRFLSPTASLEPITLGILLLLAGAGVAGAWWIERAAGEGEQNGPRGHEDSNRGPAWDELTLAAVAIIALTLASRLWFAHAHPFPAWSDSLHHTLLTELTAERGRLPATLQPYFPNNLDMYHLGLYALSGTVQMLAGAPAHAALLWTAQFLNGLCGIGVFLALDRYVGRTAAVTGLVVAGLFSAHPALWANWGRFTQLSGQVLLPIAWVLAMEAMAPDGWQASERRGGRWWTAVFAGMASAAVFLFHFRVAIFFALLLAATVAVRLWRAVTNGLGARPSTPPATKAKSVNAASSLVIERGFSIRWGVVVAMVAAVVALPALWGAADMYLGQRLAPQETTAVQQAVVVASYYNFPLSTLPYLAAPIWLLAAGAAGGLIGLIRRNHLAAVTLVWVGLLWPLGNTYRLGIPVLNVTNMGAILIMFYLPLALLIGVGVEEGLRLLKRSQRGRAQLILLALLLAAAVPAAYARGTTVEAYRHFMTGADRVAMDWIEENTPEDAVFAINVYFWLPSFPHGTDAGYWIPYWTGRDIVTSAMLSDGLSAEYKEHVLERSRAAEALESDLAALEKLYTLGVEYIYVGVRGDFSGPGLRSEFLRQSERVEILYEKDGAAVLRIHP